jgi:two-component system sensor histidine kinase DegS
MASLLYGAGLRLMECIRLRVKDSGIGFKTESRENKVGLGLVGMEERVGMLRGRLTICSQPGKGTEITAEIPLEA